jgi:hypothetical protein
LKTPDSEANQLAKRLDLEILQNLGCPEENQQLRQREEGIKGHPV